MFSWAFGDCGLKGTKAKAEGTFVETCQNHVLHTNTCWHNQNISSDSKAKKKYSVPLCHFSLFSIEITSLPHLVKYLYLKTKPQFFTYGDHYS